MNNHAAVTSLLTRRLSIEIICNDRIAADSVVWLENTMKDQLILNLAFIADDVASWMH